MLSSLKSRAVFAAAAVILGAALAGPQPVRAGGDWNDSGIEWRSYEEGLKQAKEGTSAVKKRSWTPIGPCERGGSS